MRTKIVYVLVSDDEDIYLEQTLVSMWSLRHYNPDANVVLVMDDETAEGLVNQRRSKILEYVNEQVSIPFDSSISNVERSRIIKTTLREIVHGDYLFIDSDTVITDSLSEIDSFQCHVGMVYDLHSRLIDYPFSNIIKKGTKRIFNVILKPDTNQFNSGVIYAKDDVEAHAMYNRWNDLWTSKRKETSFRDQPALVVVCNENPDVVEPLSGIYNCQIMVSIAYLHKAKIIHFFNTQWKKTSISPFFDKSLYMQIKKDGRISESIRDLILNCKSEFVTPSMPIMSTEIQLGRSHLYKCLLLLFEKHKRLFFYMESFLDALGKIKNKIKCQKKKN